SPISTLVPYTTLFRSDARSADGCIFVHSDIREPARSDDRVSRGDCLPQRVHYSGTTGEDWTLHQKQLRFLLAPIATGESVLTSRSEEHTSELQSRENL